MRLAQSQAHQPFPGFFEPGFLLLNHRFLWGAEQLTGFELEDLMSWTVSNLQRPFREDFSLKKSGIIAEKESQIFGRRFVGFDSRKSGALFQFLKGRWLQRLKRQAGEDLSGLIFL